MIPWKSTPALPTAPVPAPLVSALSSHLLTDIGLPCGYQARRSWAVEPRPAAQSVVARIFSWLSAAWAAASLAIGTR